MVPETPAIDESDAESGHGPDAESTPESDAERALPDALAAKLAQLSDLDDRPATVTGWAVASRTSIERQLGRAIAIEDLCHADDGPHVARVGDETHRFVCVLDAFVLAGLADAPVAVESPDPETDERIDIRVSADGRVDAPAGTVVTLGAAREIPDGPPTAARMYGSLCPYVHAFASQETYEAWADTVDAETTPLSVADAAHVARVLAGTA